MIDITRSTINPVATPQFNVLIITLQHTQMDIAELTYGSFSFTNTNIKYIKTTTVAWDQNYCFQSN